MSPARRMLQVIQRQLEELQPYPTPDGLAEKDKTAARLRRLLEEIQAAASSCPRCGEGGQCRCPVPTSAQLRRKDYQRNYLRTWRQEQRAAGGES